MGRMGCFFGILYGRKRKNKDPLKPLTWKGKGGSQSSLVGLVNQPSEKDLLENTSVKVVPHGSHESSPLYVNDPMDDLDAAVVPRSQVMVLEAVYEGGNEHDKISSMRSVSNFDLLEGSVSKGNQLVFELEHASVIKNKNHGDETNADMVIKSGHLSVPGIGQSTALLSSPALKRSCSNIERSIATRHLALPIKSLSCDNLQSLPVISKGASIGIQNSPLSMLSSACSADMVMLKKRSSSQVLPSRSRKLWWKLFLWSHRNLHKSFSTRPRKISSTNNNPDQYGGYFSDTLEPSGSSDGQRGETSASNTHDGLWPQKEWMAFSAETCYSDRVKAWINTHTDDTVNPSDECYNDNALCTQDFSLQSSFEIGESSGKKHSRNGRSLQDDVFQANSIAQSLNPLSAVAHISSVGLKVVPFISCFSSLRIVNLSSNFIVQISPGTLPKSLHTLDLSRNKITTIGGLRELSRLRVLNLSYNKISRIGHGLSTCTIIKELYLTGNKISHVEGLHRLLKLAVLDLSFNKITTAKSLGQLVANYQSLLALNLLGNPVQQNIGDDQLRKAVSGLLPHLTYLNRQPIKPQNAREAITDSIARAAVGNNGLNFHRRGVRRASQGSSSSRRGGGRYGPSRLHHHHSPSRSKKVVIMN